MTSIHILLGTGGVLGLILFVLSIMVVRQRLRLKVMLGDGDGALETEALRTAMRVQANFVEYVPLTLLLLSGMAMAGANCLLTIGLSALLVIARILHPIGMYRPSPNAFRASGALLTWLVLLVASGAGDPACVLNRAGLRRKHS